MSTPRADAGLSLRLAQTPQDVDAVRRLCWAYRDYLLDYSEEVRAAVSISYPKEAYTALMEALPQKHARPTGAIILAVRDGQPIGCGMYQPLNDADVEVKRVYVTDAARGTGAGVAISQALIDQARADGYKRVLLDTSRQFVHAQMLYEKLGFKQRGSYSELPDGFEKYLVFYELDL